MSIQRKEKKRKKEGELGQHPENKHKLVSAAPEEALRICTIQSNLRRMGSKVMKELFSDHRVLWREASRRNNRL